MNDMQKYLSPVKLLIGSIGGILANLLGGWDMLLKTILLLIAIDYITGILKSVYTKTISSEIGYKGIIKKAMLIFIIAMSHAIQQSLSSDLPIREMTITLFIANEAISILENASACGLPVPKFLKDLLIQIRSE